MTSSTNLESLKPETDESLKNERRDRKKQRRITNKKDKTPEDIRKLKVLSAKITYYDKIKNLRNAKTEPTHEKETDDEFLHTAYNENKGYWEKEYERRKIAAEEKARQGERKRQEAVEENARQEAEKKCNDQCKQITCVTSDIRQTVADIIYMGKTIPKDILEFLNNTYNGKKRKIIYKKYHPDKNEDKTLYEAYSKLIGSHNDTPCKSSGLH